MTHVMALAAGTELVGDFKIERVLGAGGFGITYLADELALARRVTIKEYFPADFAARTEGSRAVPRSDTCRGDYDWGLDRFMGEAQTLARFDHPNIVRVYRYFRENNTGYMVLHFEEGRSLKGWLTALGRAPRQNELDDILKPLLDALETVHASDYLHRDIAPDNIIVRTDGSPVLIDFGSARCDVARHSRTVSALVKPGYSPYEQYAETGSRQGAWSDIYALAATIYFAITGKRPPDAPSRIVKDEMVSASDAAIGAYRRTFLKAIDRALSLNIDRRPQTIAALRDELLAPEPQRRSWFTDNKGPVASEPAQAPRPAGDAPTLVLPAAKAVLAPSPPPIPSPKTERAVARAATLAEALAEVQAKRPVQPGSSADYLDRLDRLEKNDGLPRTKDVAAEVRRNAPRSPKVARTPFWRAIPRPSLAALSGVLAKAQQALAIERLPQPVARGSNAGTPIAPAPPAAEKIAKANAKARATAGPKAVAAARPKASASAAAGTPSRGLFGWPRLPRIEIKRPVAIATPRNWRRLAIPLAVGALVTGIVVMVQGRAPDMSLASSILGGQRTSALVKEFTAHDGGANGVRFANAESWIVTSGADGSIKVWNAGWGSLVRSIRLENGPATSLAVDGTMALTGHADGTTVLWDLASSRKAATFRRNDANIRAVAFSGGQARVVTAAKDASIAIWDASKSGKPLEVFEDHDDAVQAVAASHDGQMIASGGADRIARLFNAATLSLKRSYRGHGDPVTAVALSPDGALLASGAGDGVIRIWSTRTGRRLKLLRGHRGAVSGLAFSADGQQLASAAADGAIKLWRPTKSGLLRTFGPSSAAITAIDISADGSRIVAVAADGKVRFWDTRFKATRSDE